MLIRISDEEVELKDMEIKCIYWAARGRTTEEIAQEMCLDKRKVDYYRAMIMDKLYCNNMQQVIFVAIKNKIISVDD